MGEAPLSGTAVPTARSSVWRRMRDYSAISGAWTRRWPGSITGISG